MSMFYLLRWKSDRTQKWLQINTAFISAAKCLFAFRISFGCDRAPQNNLNQFSHLNMTEPLANWAMIIVPTYILTSASPYKTPRLDTLALYECILAHFIPHMQTWLATISSMCQLNEGLHRYTATHATCSLSAWFLMRLIDLPFMKLKRGALLSDVVWCVICQSCSRRVSSTAQVVLCSGTAGTIRLT